MTKDEVGCQPEPTPRERGNEERSSLRATLIEREEDLAEYREAWDALACELGRPYASPAWALAWWHHVADRGCRLRVVAVMDGENLVGLAPWFAQPPRRRVTDYRLLGAGTSHRIEPLARSGDKPTVAALVARMLRSTMRGPSIVHFEGIDAQSGWPDLLAANWPDPRPPWIHRQRAMAAPTLQIHGSLAQWLSTHRRSVRRDLPRLLRRLEENGGGVRITRTVDQLPGDIEGFTRVHRARWAPRGGSNLPAGAGAMLLEAGREMLPSGRFRVYSVDGPTELLAVVIFVAAGGRVALWNSGWKDEGRYYRPVLQAIMAAIRDAFGHREQLVDFGGGDALYKRRIANGDEPVAWIALYPRGNGYLTARALTAPRRLRQRVRRLLRRLSPAARHRLKGIRR